MKMLEFMNPLGATVAVLPVMEHWSVVAQFNCWPGIMKSGGTENQLAETQATIVIWNYACTLFDQTFFDPVAEITFLLLFFWANHVSSMLKIQPSVIFCSLTCSMNSHVKICRPSYVTSALKSLITWEVWVINNGCRFMNRFNHPLFRFPADRLGPYNPQYILFPFINIMSRVTRYTWLCIPIIQSTKS